MVIVWRLRGNIIRTEVLQEVSSFFLYQTFNAWLLTRHGITMHPITLLYNSALAYCENESLKLWRHNFPQKFFKQICHPGNCLHGLLPPECDPFVSLRLRHPTVYPIPLVRMKRHRSFINYSLQYYQWQLFMSVIVSFHFYCAACNAEAVLWWEFCPSVCPSVTRVYCDKTVERSVQIYIPYERTFSLVYWEQERLVGDDPFYVKFWVNGPPFEQNRRFSTNNSS